MRKNKPRSDYSALLSSVPLSAISAAPLRKEIYDIMEAYERKAGEPFFKALAKMLYEENLSKAAICARMGDSRGRRMSEATLYKAISLALSYSSYGQDDGFFDPECMSVRSYADLGCVLPENLERKLARLEKENGPIIFYMAQQIHERGRTRYELAKELGLYWGRITMLLAAAGVPMPKAEAGDCSLREADE